MDYKIINKIEAKDLKKLRDMIGWMDVSEKCLQKGLDNTMCMVSIKSSDDDIIAVGRVVGDYAAKGVLSDIIVNPNYQGKGYGKIVVTNLLKQIEDTVEEGSIFMLEATPTAGNRDFYVNCGMKYKPTNQDGVYAWIFK